MATKRSCETTKPVKVRSHCRKKRNKFPARNKDGTFKKKVTRAPARKTGAKKASTTQKRTPTKAARSTTPAPVKQIQKVAKKAIKGTQQALF